MHLTCIEVVRCQAGDSAGPVLVALPRCNLAGLSPPGGQPHPNLDKPHALQAMASANSRGDAEGAGRGFIQAAAATLVVSSVLVTVLLSAPEALLGMFQNDPEVLALAKTYCMIRSVCVGCCGFITKPYKEMNA